ncbi:MAG: aldose epimerase family protein [Acidimicrobiia bacterium]
MEMTHTGFGLAKDGTPVDQFAIGNAQGMSVELINLGATVKSVSVPDRDGQRSNVTLGFPSLDGYLGSHPYFGSTVGRFANRIAGGSFPLEGTVHRLALNDGPNHLHGGEVGFSHVVWTAEPFESDGEAGVRFEYHSPDGEERYPGNLTVEATYSLTEANELVMAFEATSDRPTPVNLINHAYWNLGGAGDTLDHVLTIEADHYLPVDATQIPTGSIAPVAGTALDFTVAKPVGRDIDDVPGSRVGYDFCYVLRHRSAPAPAARLMHEGSGRVMEVITSQPGLQLYTGNNLTGFEPHGGFGRFAGLCLETQHFPDAPNRPEWPSTILGPGERYAHVTIHRFSND